MSVDAESIKSQIREFIVSEFLPGESADNLGDDLPLKDSGILDSMSTLSLVSFVEKTFGLEVAPHEASNEFGTVAEIAALVVRKMS